MVNVNVTIGNKNELLRKISLTWNRAGLFKGLPMFEPLPVCAGLQCLKVMKFWDTTCEHKCFPMSPTGFNWLPKMPQMQEGPDRSLTLLMK